MGDNPLVFWMRKCTTAEDKRDEARAELERVRKDAEEIARITEKLGGLSSAVYEVLEDMCEQDPEKMSGRANAWRMKLSRAFEKYG